MQFLPLRSAWLRLPVALLCVVPVFALHLTIARWTGTRGTLTGALLAAAVASLLGCAAYAAYVRVFERRPVLELGVRKAPAEAAAGFAIGAAYFGVTIGVLAALGAYAISGSRDLAVATVPLVSSVGTAFIEEILFRGIVFRIVEGALGTWMSLAISSALFGLLHLVNPDATLQGAVAIVIEAGVLLGAAFVLTRRLWLPIGIHAGWNFTQGGIFGVAVSGFRSRGVFEGTLAGPEWLSGGSFGAEASVVAVVLGVVLGAALVVAAFRRGHFVRPFWRRPATPASTAVDAATEQRRAGA